VAGGYSTSDVAKLLGLSPQQVRSFVRDGLVAAERVGNRYRFTFGDLVLLRAAKDLVAARVPPRHIKKALAGLKRDLPEDRGLAGLRIGAEGARVVVHDGAKRWNPESGQMHFTFDVDDLARQAQPLAVRQARDATRREMSAEQWYDLGCELEEPAPDRARQAYTHAVALDPEHLDAHLNLGRLLHEAGELNAALGHYRAAIELDPGDGTAAFNLGVLLEDLGKESLALDAYQRAMRSDPESPDAYFNAGALCERMGRRAAALRYLKTYKELTDA
jgi:excisionase family DNA binding protein